LAALSELQRTPAGARGALHLLIWGETPRIRLKDAWLGAASDQRRRKVIRHAAAVSIALISYVTPVFAQSATPIAELVVRVTADVHQGPSTASPIVGKAPGGTTLHINRNLGSWVEVPWPGTAARIAFVHVTTGTIAPRSTAPVVNEARAAVAQIAAVAASAGAASVQEGASAGRFAATNQFAARAADYVLLPPHHIGLGALLDTSTLRFGGSARTWWGRRFGVQFSMSRPELASADGQLIPSTQFAPSAMYSLPEGVTDSVWVRPYVGTGPRFYRAHLQTALGYETFGGVEVTLAAMPQFALSADMGYRWRRPSLGDFTPQQTAFSLSGHWYVK
jgi:hypothetical protein